MKFFYKVYFKVFSAGPKHANKIINTMIIVFGIWKIVRYISAVANLFIYICNAKV